MRWHAVLLLQVVLAPLLAAGSPRIAFERVLPASHSLGSARELAVIHAASESRTGDIFVEHFVDQVNHGGLLRARDAREGTGSADAYLSVQTLQCETFNREGEGSARDYEGNRVKRKQVWIDAVCAARIDVLGRDRSRLSMFFGKGEGTSPRVDTITEEEKAIALRQAARYAAIDAAARITPRRVREYVLLDESGPAFEEAMVLIESGRLADARSTWEAEMRRNPRSAPLHFNLAAVCEALGDRAAAKSHYVAATQLAPKEERYKHEMRLFARRE